MIDASTLSPRIHVYLAGPYSQPDPVQNTNRAIQVAQILWEGGFAVFCPHLSMLWHAILPNPYETWLEMDLLWLAKCDVLLRIPGTSPGAEREVDFARARDIPVFYSVGELMEWKSRRLV